MSTSWFRCIAAIATCLPWTASDPAVATAADDLPIFQGDSVAEAVTRPAPVLERLRPVVEAPVEAPPASSTPAVTADVLPERRPPPIELRAADLHAGEVLVPMSMSQIIEVGRRYGEVTIGNSDIADVVPLSTTSIYVFGKQFGTTSLTLTGASNEVIAVVDLVVTFDIEGLKRQLHELVPGQAIEVRPAHDGLVLSGRVSSAAQLDRVLAVAERYAPERITNLIEVTGSQQVMLMVRFAEVQRAVVKQLGFSNIIIANGDDVSGALISGDGPSTDPAAFAIADLIASIGDVSLDFLLDTLEEKGVIKTLAEPNLIALSGDSARFLAGGEFPIPVGRNEDNDGVEISIEFKEFGVGLSFTPTVLGPDLINLELFTEVSEIDPVTSIILDDLVIPGLKVRRATTTIELADGSSFAIAGLLQEEFEDAVRQFPILGDVPVLGTLFRSTSWQTGQTELVVIVTPHLVRPARTEQFTTPDQLFVPPTQSELFLLGRIEGEPAPPPQPLLAPQGASGAAGIAGPYGYILK